MKILGVRVDNLEKGDILGKIEIFLGGNDFRQIATINPEFVLRSREDAEFRNILNESDLNVADGVGIKLAFWRCGRKLKCRFAGVDLMNEILKMASNRELSVFLVTNKSGLSSFEEVSAAIKARYPNIKIGGVNWDKIISGSRFPSLNHDSKSGLQAQNWKDYQIIFCNFGSPFQEKFIHSLKQGDYGKIKIAVGVGGSFDFWTGKLRRAPSWMQEIGLEWLFRLVQQPGRLRRIFNAVIVFPLSIIKNKCE